MSGSPRPSLSRRHICRPPPPSHIRPLARADASSGESLHSEISRAVAGYIPLFEHSSTSTQHAAEVGSLVRNVELRRGTTSQQQNSSKPSNALKNRECMHSGIMVVFSGVRVTTFPDSWAIAHVSSPTATPAVQRQRRPRRCGTHSPSTPLPEEAGARIHLRTSASQQTGAHLLQRRRRQGVGLLEQ